MLGGLVPSPTIDLSAASKSKPKPIPSRQITPQTPAPPEGPPDPVARTAVSLEYASLRHKEHCPLGMYVTPSTSNLFIWDAVFFVHQGYYVDSILKFRLTFPQDYPEHPPAVHFRTDVFHPLIQQQSGIFNLAPRFRPWRPREHHIFDVLHWVKAAFKKHALDGIQETDCLNKQAFRYHESTASFAALATQSSVLSQSSSALFDSHPTKSGKGRDGLIFRELKPETMSSLRSKFGLREWECED